MDSIPACILALWEAEAYNETYPDRPRKTVLLTSFDFDALEAYTRTQVKKPIREPIVSKTSGIKDVTSATMTF